MNRALCCLSGFRYHGLSVRKGRNVSSSKQEFSLCHPSIKLTTAVLQSDQTLFIKYEIDIED